MPPDAISLNFWRKLPLEVKMSKGNKHSKTATPKETTKRKYDKERMEEFLLDAIMDMQELGNDDNPEIIFVDDEPLIL
jgi:hypothetical protein